VLVIVLVFLQEYDYSKDTVREVAADTFIPLGQSRGSEKGEPGEFEPG
jgi:hypothetical protein